MILCSGCKCLLIKPTALINYLTGTPRWPVQGRAKVEIPSATLAAEGSPTGQLTDGRPSIRLPCPMAGCQLPAGFRCQLLFRHVPSPHHESVGQTLPVQEVRAAGAGPGGLLLPVPRWPACAAGEYSVGPEGGQVGQWTGLPGSRAAICCGLLFLLNSVGGCPAPVADGPGTSKQTDPIWFTGLHGCDPPCAVSPLCCIHPALSPLVPAQAPSLRWGWPLSASLQVCGPPVDDPAPCQAGGLSPKPAPFQSPPRCH